MSTARTSVRQLGVALRAVAVLTLALGLVYPLVITGVGQAVAGNQANGSPVTVDGTTVGSELIGQPFTDAGGAAMPQWFQSRPSAAERATTAASGGSNPGPTNPELAALIGERRTAVAELEGVNPDEVPAEAVTASASGLDPHISPEYALLQVDRVAAERGLDAADVRALVDAAVEDRTAGVLGEPRVNVLKLNIRLAELDT